MGINKNYYNIWVTRLELAQYFNHPGLNGTCLPIPAHPLYFNA
jgi:hypothetical protein